MGACSQHTAMAVQDSSTSGANVKRLDSESSAAVKSIEKSISSKKQEVRQHSLPLLLPQ